MGQPAHLEQGGAAAAGLVQAQGGCCEAPVAGTSEASLQVDTYGVGWAVVGAAQALVDVEVAPGPLHPAGIRGLLTLARQAGSICKALLSGDNVMKPSILAPCDVEGAAGPSMLQA